MDQWWSSGQVWGSPCTGSLLGTSFCVVIRGFSSKLSVLENNIRLSRLGPRENITLWRRAKAEAVYPLRAVNAFSPLQLLSSKMSVCQRSLVAFYMEIIPRHSVLVQVRRALGPSLNGTLAAVPQQGIVRDRVQVGSRRTACCLTGRWTLVAGCKTYQIRFLS